MEELRIVITTSDNYLPALRPMAYLLNKYYVPNPPVLVSGFTPPDFDLPANFTFHSIGKMEDYPVGKWSDGIIKLLHEIPDEVFLLLLEDMWPVRQVNVDAVNILYRYMLQFKNVIKMDLYTDRLYAGGADLNYGHVSYIDLVKSDPNSAYHFSLMPGLWRKEHLLRVLVPGESPWSAETTSGTPRLRTMKDLDVLGTRMCPYRGTLAFRGGDSGKLLLSELQDCDVKELRDLGYLAPWEK